MIAFTHQILSARSGSGIHRRKSLAGAIIDSGAIIDNPDKLENVNVMVSRIR